MHDSQSIVMILLQSILTGFGIVIPILALIRTSNLKTIAVKDLFILTAVQMVRLAGIFYFILVAIDAWAYFADGTSYMHSNIPQKSYLIYTYFPPVITLLFSQLFWIKRLYMKKAALVTFALLLVVAPVIPNIGKHYERFVIITTSSHRDYLPEGAVSSIITTQLLSILLNIIVFIFITFAVMLAGGKLKKIV